MVENIKGKIILTPRIEITSIQRTIFHKHAGELALHLTPDQLSRVQQTVAQIETARGQFRKPRRIPAFSQPIAENTRLVCENGLYRIEKKSETEWIPVWAEKPARKVSSRFPLLYQNIMAWVRNRPKFAKYDLRKKSRVAKSILKHGFNFLQQFYEEAGQNPFFDHAIASTPESPVTISSQEARIKAAVSFQENAVLIDGLQGFAIQEKTDPIRFFKEIRGVAKRAGYEKICLIDPEKQPYYMLDSEELELMWMHRIEKTSEKVSDLMKEGRPTLFELNEIQIEHQKRMKTLYRRVITRFKMKKQENSQYFELAA